MLYWYFKTDLLEYDDEKSKICVICFSRIFQIIEKKIFSIFSKRLRNFQLFKFYCYSLMDNFFSFYYFFKQKKTNLVKLFIIYSNLDDYSWFSI